jgi:hypothetical protein
MTDLTNLENAAKTALSGAAAKQEGKLVAWMKTYYGPFLTGFGVCAFLWFVVHRYL